MTREVLIPDDFENNNQIYDLALVPQQDEIGFIEDLYSEDKKEQIKEAKIVSLGGEVFLRKVAKKKSLFPRPPEKKDSPIVKREVFGVSAIAISGLVELLDDEFYDDTDDEDDYDIPINSEPLCGDVTEAIEARKKLTSQPLLTFEEEQALGRRVTEAKEAVMTLKDDSISLEQRELLESVITEGKEARRIFIEANYKFVPYAARRFLRKGMGDQDILQSGMEGLVKAVDGFDYTYGFRFSTYAYKVIRHTIMSHLTENLRTVHIPQRIIQKVYAHSQLVESLRRDLGREPTMQEIIDKSENSHAGVKELERVKNTQTVSLYEEAPENDSQRLVDKLSDNNAPSAEPIFLDNEFETSLDSFVNKELTSVERVILNLFRQNDLTYEEVGKMLGVSRQRIEQRLKSIKAKLSIFLNEYNSVST